MSGNKAMRRAVTTAGAVRINADLPLIVDTTELITPEVAQELLNRNRFNRPINWNQVELYAKTMSDGEFKLTAQGIVIDKNGNLLTGQTRLWAVILSNCSVYMRVSRGNDPATGRLLDRGRPQSARDLATRSSEQKHAPTEASIARAICALTGEMKPSNDRLAEVIAANSPLAKTILKSISGLKKSKSVLMIVAALCVKSKKEAVDHLFVRISEFSDALDIALMPHTASSCWGRGAAFGLALEHARRIIG